MRSQTSKLANSEVCRNAGIATDKQVKKKKMEGGNRKQKRGGGRKQDNKMLPPLREKNRPT